MTQIDADKVYKLGDVLRAEMLRVLRANIPLTRADAAAGIAAAIALSIQRSEHEQFFSSVRQIADAFGDADREFQSWLLEPQRKN